MESLYNKYTALWIDFDSIEKQIKEWGIDEQFYQNFYSTLEKIKKDYQIYFVGTLSHGDFFQRLQMLHLDQYGHFLTFYNLMTSSKKCLVEKEMYSKTKPYTSLAILELQEIMIKQYSNHFENILFISSDMLHIQAMKKVNIDTCLIENWHKETADEREQLVKYQMQKYPVHFSFSKDKKKSTSFLLPTHQIPDFSNLTLLKKKQKYGNKNLFVDIDIFDRYFEQDPNFCFEKIEESFKSFQNDYNIHYFKTNQFPIELPSNVLESELPLEQFNYQQKQKCFAFTNDPQYLALFQFYGIKTITYRPTYLDMADIIPFQTISDLRELQSVLEIEKTESVNKLR